MDNLAYIWSPAVVYKTLDQFFHSNASFALLHRLDTICQTTFVQGRDLILGLVLSLDWNFHIFAVLPSRQIYNQCKCTNNYAKRWSLPEELAPTTAPLWWTPTRLATLAISSPLSVATIDRPSPSLLHTSIRRGRSIEPVKKVFSLQCSWVGIFQTKNSVKPKNLVGCHVALKGVNHLPVWLLCRTCDSW